MRSLCSSEHLTHSAGPHAQATRRRRCRARWSSAPPSARPPPGWRTRPGPEICSTARSPPGPAASGRGAAAPAARAPCGRCRRRTACRGRPARSGGAVAVGGQRGHHAVGYVLGPDRLEQRAAAAGDRHQRAAAPAGRAASSRGRWARRRSRARRPWVSRLERSTASRARDLERMKRVREAGLAPRAEKNRNREAPPRSAALTSRSVATAEQLLDRAPRLVADRGGQVDDGVHAAQGVAERRRGRPGRPGRAARARARRLAAWGRARGSARAPRRPRAVAGGPTRRCPWRR